MAYVAPEFGSAAFNCPHCNVYSEMTWYFTVFKTHPEDRGWRRWGLDLATNSPGAVDFSGATCHHCGEVSAWLYGVMYLPQGSLAPKPHADMPDAVKEIYQEAASVVQFSPRAAVALLRLALERLMVELGAEGKSIDKQIGYLVEKGLSPIIQQSLDALRILGNEAIHIGEIDVTEQQTVASVFQLANLIVEQMISVPKHVQAVYEGLPESKLEGIEKRDGKIR